MKRLCLFIIFFIFFGTQVMADGKKGWEFNFTFAVGEAADVYQFGVGYNVYTSFVELKQGTVKVDFICDGELDFRFFKYNGDIRDALLTSLKVDAFPALRFDRGMLQPYLGFGPSLGADYYENFETDDNSYFGKYGFVSQAGLRIEMETYYLHGAFRYRYVWEKGENNLGSYSGRVQGCSLMLSGGFDMGGFFLEPGFEMTVKRTYSGYSGTWGPWMKMEHALYKLRIRIVKPI